MDSATSKQTTEQARQADIRRQIALLQAQLGDAPSDSGPVTDIPVSGQQKRAATSILVPDTPTSQSD